jgi:hypothetical protein
VPLPREHTTTLPHAVRRVDSTSILQKPVFHCHIQACGCAYCLPTSSTGREEAAAAAAPGAGMTTMAESAQETALISGFSGSEFRVKSQGLIQGPGFSGTVGVGRTVATR